MYYDIILASTRNTLTLRGGRWGIAQMRLLRLNERVDFSISSSVSLRVYADSLPRVLQTAKLQKGPILVCNGKELAEEGLGLGVPVCRYVDGTRFSLSADTFVDHSRRRQSIVKIYNIDGIASKRFRGVPIRRGKYLASLLKVLEAGYRWLRRYMANAALMLDLISFLGMTNEYVPSRSKGQIEVVYRCSGASIQISANLEGLSQEGLQSTVFANEQGGTLFSKYTDSTGVELRGREIEPWRTTSAEWASLHSPEFGVGFSLQRPSGWSIVRGREVVKDRISWSGLDLLYRGIPQALEYRVTVAGGSAAD
jgi:hypothetical protein